MERPLQVYALNVFTCLLLDVTVEFETNKKLLLVQRRFGAGV